MKKVIVNYSVMQVKNNKIASHIDLHGLSTSNRVYYKSGWVDCMQKSLIAELFIKRAKIIEAPIKFYAVDSG